MLASRQTSRWRPVWSGPGCADQCERAEYQPGNLEHTHFQHYVELTDGVTEDGQGETEEDGEEAHHLPGLRAPVHVVLDRVEDGNKSEES